MWSGDAAQPRGRRPPAHPSHRGPVAALLGVGLFWKILGANAVLVGAAVAVGGWLASSAADGRALSGAVVPALALSAVALSLGVNALLLWIALRPIRSLEETAQRVSRGDLSARAEASALADPDLLRLIRTTNATLDRLEAQRQRLREMAGRALNAAEEERRRLARELHDETAQTLTMLLVRMRAARGTADEAERERTLDEVRDALASTAERIRCMAQGLQPPALEMMGLIPALTALAHEVEEQTGIEIDVQGGRLESAPLSVTRTLALYRIVQEALSNVARHSGAGRAQVVVRPLNGRVEVVVSDDGRGFAVPEVMQDRERGLGLFGMEERAAWLGGRLHIVSSPGDGTRVEVEIPIAGEESTFDG